MKLTLMIEGSAATIAAVLAALPDGAGIGVTVHNHVTTAPAAADDEDDDTGPADANAPTVDGEGLAWDERIHSSNKKLTGRGVWTKRRGVDAATIAAIEAELRGGTVTEPVPMQMPDRPIPFPTAMPMQPISMAAAPVAMPAPVAAPAMPTAMPAATASMPVVPSAVTAEPSTVTFPTFMATISQQMQAGVISEDELKWVAGEIGVAVITDCAAQPEKIDAALALFRQYGKWVD